MGIDGVAANDGQLHGRARCAAQRAHPFPDRHVARRLAVDHSDEIAGAEPGLRGGRVIARRDHAQVILTGELEADVARRQRRAALRLLDLLRRQKRAVWIERLGEPPHRAVHDLVDVDRLDVVVGNQLGHIVEDPQVLVRFFARHHFAEEAADDREDNHGSRDGQDDQAGTGTHGASGAKKGASVRDAGLKVVRVGTSHSAPRTPHLALPHPHRIIVS